jgi:hypothetical protein
MSRALLLILLLEGERYAAPNRFFAHWTMAHYFRHVPLALQSFLSPIDSVYAAAALAKTAIQLLLIWLLAAAVITPLFQTFGYNGLMGVIDKSVTFTFFFALPMGLLLLFFLPFYKKMRMPAAMQAGWAFLALFLALNGPLVPGVVLVACLLTLADEPGTGHNACEKSALETLSHAQESPVRLPGSCTVMSWEKISAPSISEWNARMLERWGVTEGKVLYVQE